MKKKSVTLHMNDTLEAMGRRFTDAWHRAEAGEAMDESHVGYVKMEAMISALSPRRMELLQALHAHPAKDVKALSVALGRDYKRVYEDVRELSIAGLVERSKEGVRVPFDTIRAEMAL